MSALKVRGLSRDVKAMGCMGVVKAMGIVSCGKMGRVNYGRVYGMTSCVNITGRVYGMASVVSITGRVYGISSCVKMTGRVWRVNDDNTRSVSKFGRVYGMVSCANTLCFRRGPY